MLGCFLNFSVPRPSLSHVFSELIFLCCLVFRFYVHNYHFPVFKTGSLTRDKFFKRICKSRILHFFFHMQTIRQSKSIFFFFCSSFPVKTVFVYTMNSLDNFADLVKILYKICSWFVLSLQKLEIKPGFIFHGSSSKCGQC